jgi:PAS domain S-box-containing protein
MIFDQVFTKGVSAHFECRIISHKRQVVYTEQSIISTVDDKGKFVGAQGLIRDITDKKVAEILRNKAESVTLALLENLKEAVVVIDANSKITFVSNALENVLGYAAEELVGKPSIKLTTDEDQPRVAALFKEMAEGGTDVQYTKKADFQYDGVSKKVCIDWSQAIKDAGDYKVELYQSGYLIGKGSVKLK